MHVNPLLQQYLTVLYSLGEKGHLIISPAIRLWFPFDGVTANHIFAPIPLQDFIEYVAVPHCTAMILSSDQDITFSEAVTLLTESADFGAALYPIDELEDDQEIDQIVQFIHHHGAKFWGHKENDRLDLNEILVSLFNCLLV